MLPLPATQKDHKLVFSLEVKSIEELEEAIAAQEPSKPFEDRFISLHLYGPQVIFRPFEYPKLSNQDFKYALLLDAVELLHVGPEEIELDYQVLETTADKIKGVFLAATKSLVKEYIACCDRFQVVPINITTSAIVAVDSFLHKKKTESSCFCLLDFCPGNRVIVAVFYDSQCVLLREAYYETPEEAEQEIINSLKYSCAKSASKQLSEVYISGNIPEHGNLVALLQNKIDVDPQKGDFTDHTMSAYYPNSLFKLNLLKNYALTLSERKSILHIGSILALLCLIACLAKGIVVVENGRTIKNLKASFNAEDYSRAVELSGKVKLLGHGQ